MRLYSANKICENVFLNNVFFCDDLLMRLEKLKDFYANNGLNDLFEIRVEQDYPDKKYSAIRLKQNTIRIRSFELWENTKGEFYRVYHGKVPEAIKDELNSFPDQVRSTSHYSDFIGDPNEIFSFFANLFSSDITREIAKKNQVYTRNSAYDNGTDLSETTCHSKGLLKRNRL